MRSSQRKQDSARANGAKSRGPITQDGRSNSAQASIIHGFTSQTICLTNESRPRFEQMQREYIDHYQPVGPVENDLIEDLVAAKWQQRRIWAIRTATLDLRLEKQKPEIAQTFAAIDEPGRLALAFAAESDESHTQVRWFGLTTFVLQLAQSLERRPTHPH